MEEILRLYEKGEEVLILLKSGKRAIPAVNRATKWLADFKRLRQAFMDTDQLAVEIQKLRDKKMPAYEEERKNAAAPILE